MRIISRHVQGSSDITHGTNPWLGNRKWNCDHAKGVSGKADHLEELLDLDVIRTLLLQETEKGMLFARESRWKDLKGSLRQLLGGIGRHLTLWKTSIQTIEARHGECLSHTAVR